jgi:Kef-type K+ transport system membrane component KefB
MWFAVRPVLARLVAHEERREGPLSRTAIALSFGLLLFSALATESIGVHALFGAFLAGVIVPKGGRLPDQLVARLGDLVTIFLLPTFFALSGMRTEIGLLSTPGDWAACGLVATAGKLGGTYAAARLMRIPGREAAALGFLMNTRGLMELVVLNLGLDLGILSPKLFTMFVLMALVTTFAAPLAVDAVLGNSRRDRDAATPGS